jgi:hypothetical protein
MWYKRAADLGNTPGMVNLGWLYEWGKGVELDAGKAASLPTLSEHLLAGPSFRRRPAAPAASPNGQAAA